MLGRERQRRSAPWYILQPGGSRWLGEVGVRIGQRKVSSVLLRVSDKWLAGEGSKDEVLSKETRFFASRWDGWDSDVSY